MGLVMAFFTGFGGGIFIGNDYIVDQNPGCLPYHPIVNILHVPTLGSSEPIRLSVSCLPGWNYVYVFSETHLLLWAFPRERGVIFLYPPDKWTGPITLKVVVSTHPRWSGLENKPLPLPISRLGKFIPPRCGEGIKVYQFFIVFPSPAPCSYFPAKP